MTRDDGYGRSIRRGRSERAVLFDGEAKGRVLMFYTMGELANVRAGRSVFCYGEV
jgi:hypothetical protein